MWINTVPRDKQLWDLIAKGFCHLFTTDISDALQCQIDVNRIAWGEIIFYTLNNQLDQVAVSVDQDRYEKVTLELDMVII